MMLLVRWFYALQTFLMGLLALWMVRHAEGTGGAVLLVAALAMSAVPWVPTNALLRGALCAAVVGAGLFALIVSWALLNA
jgi:hypothetical protein